MRKRVASLRLCVSSLHRDHANLLCIFKRLFNDPFSDFTFTQVYQIKTQLCLFMLVACVSYLCERMTSERCFSSLDCEVVVMHVLIVSSSMMNDDDNE